MTRLAQAAADFLRLERIAVFGVSRNPRNAANAIYRKLRASGHAVVAINPNAETVEGDVCYPDLASAPAGVGGAVIVTKPEIAAALVDACAAAGVRQIWFHQGMGPGSVSPEAIERCRGLGLQAIPGACPMMFCDPVDFGHRCIRFVKKLTGSLPEPVH